MNPLVAPLKRMRLIQPFGVDYLGNNGPGGKSYADIGLKNGHNGWDLSCVTGTEVFAAIDGELTYTDGGTGYGRDIRVKDKEKGIEVVYGHLLNLVGADKRQVKAGDLIAFSNNTGFSTGPHLHFGIRFFSYQGTAGPFIKDGNNGYFGYVDPTPYFAPDVFDLPVDKQYGLTNQTLGVPSEIEWQKTNEWVFKNLKRLLTTREMKALRYGFWDLRTVLDPAMFPVWSEMHKPAYLKKCE
jgi:murein DD-endopeptidase MepM/ murein hydrolase activator NlpD